MMLLAHLRGKLEPYYSQGVRSIIAERAMLRVIASEISADVEKHMLIAEAAFAPLLQPDSARRMYKTIVGGFSDVRDKAMLDFVTSTQRARQTDEGLAALYEHLKASGFFDRLNAETDKILRKRYQQRN